MSAKRAINDQLQGSVATYLKCVGVVKNQIKRFIAESASEKKLKSANIWQSYKQERDCLMFVARLTNTLLELEESARDNLCCEFLTQQEREVAIEDW